MAAATNARFMWQNEADSGTVTASESAVGFPASNIQTTFLQEVWESQNDTGTKSLKWDMGTATAAMCAVISGHNLSSSATVELYGSTDDFSSSNVHIGSFPTNRVDNLAVIGLSTTRLYFNAVNYRYYKITMVDAMNSTGYLYVGRVFIGTYSAMTKNYMYPWSITPVSLSVTQRALNGVVHVNQKPTYHVLDIGFHVVDVSQKDAIRQIVDNVGVHSPFWIDVAPDDAASDLYCIYGRFSKLPKMSNTRWVLWDVQCNIEEDL